MKLSRLLVVAVIFVVALTVSRSVSLAIFHPYSFSTPEYTISSQIHSEESQPITEQLNFLLIQTNQSTNSKPIGIWWAAIAPKSPITLVSLYPNSNLDMVSLLESYQITQGNHLSAEFISKIYAEDIPLNGYLILDPTAMAILIDSVGGLNINGNYVDGKQVTEYFHEIQPNSLKDRAYQSEVWTKLCQKTIFAGSSGILELVKNELSKHTIVSPDFPISFRDFQAFISDSSLKNCEVNLMKSNSWMELSSLQISRRTDGN